MAWTRVKVEADGDGPPRPQDIIVTDMNTGEPIRNIRSISFNAEANDRYVDVEILVMAGFEYIGPADVIRAVIREDGTYEPVEETPVVLPQGLVVQGVDEGRVIWRWRKDWDWHAADSLEEAIKAAKSAGWKRQDGGDE